MTDLRAARQVAARLGVTGAVRPLGSGLDHVAYEVGGLVVRFGAGAGREARLLQALPAWSPLPVPEVAGAGDGWLAYRKLPGAPLLDGGPAAPPVAPLTAFLAALHAVPLGQVAGLVDVDPAPRTEWLTAAATAYPDVAAHLPAGYGPRIEAFLDEPPPADAAALAFCHNDLGIEHVLVDAEGRVTGVIDWSDAAVTDPADDHGRLLRDLGPAAAPADPALRERARFVARCSLLEDLAFGLETGRRRYVDKSLAALPWLFGP